MKMIAAVVVMTLPGIVAGAQINKCVDASGKVVGYAAECPQGTRSEATKIRSSPASSETAKGLAERDADFRKRQIERQEAAAKAEQKTADAAQRKHACEEARSHLKSLQERQRITRTDPKSGESIFLKDSDYPQEMQRTQRFLSDNCT